MRENGVDEKPLWNPETGWAFPKPFPSEELGAAYLARTYLLAWSAGVQRLYWYSWDNHTWVTLQTTEKDNITLTPAGRAYETVYTWMVGARLEECTQGGDNTWTCKLSRNGSIEWIVWNPAHSESFIPPEQWHAKFVVSLQGVSQALTNSGFEAGFSPGACYFCRAIELRSSSPEFCPAEIVSLTRHKNRELIMDRTTQRQKLALLVNIISPARIALYSGLASRFDLLLLHGGNESNRDTWQGMEQLLPNAKVIKAWGWQIRLKRRVNGSLFDSRYLHFTPGYIGHLLRFRPDVVVTNEMGLRTLIALIYGTIARKPVWVLVGRHTPHRAWRRTR